MPYTKQQWHDDTTGTDAWGGFSFELWNVDSLPRAIGSYA